MTELERFIVSVFDVLTHKLSFSENEIYKETGYNKIKFEEIIDDIKQSNKNINSIDKSDELYIMLKKSLAILVLFPHNKDNVIIKNTGKTKEELHKFLSSLCEKDVTEKDYFDIQNQ